MLTSQRVRDSEKRLTFTMKGIVLRHAYEKKERAQLAEEIAKQEEEKAKMLGENPISQQGRVNRDIEIGGAS